jgi:hypothetical protein
MRLKPPQFRCRPAMRWPVDTGLVPATRATAKAGKPYRDLAEQRGDHMVLIVLHTANTATAGAGWSPNGVIPDLCRDNLLLEAGPASCSNRHYSCARGGAIAVYDPDRRYFRRGRQWPSCPPR